MFRTFATLALALGASACSLWPFGSGSSAAGPEAAGRERTGLAAEADKLLAADRAFAATVVEVGAPDAFQLFFDEQGLHLAVAGEPVTGADAVRAHLVAGQGHLLSWEPRYAEVFAPGHWGWTWGEWQAHEPGAGGRRIAEGRYVNVWKKQRDGSWKVRADLSSREAAPR